MFNSYSEYLEYLKSGANLTKSEFDKKLINTKYKILGLKLPELRKLAKEIIKQNNGDLILSNQNFTYYEELLIYSFVLSSISLSENKRIDKINNFISYIDNWSNCDSFCSSLKVVKKNKDIYLNYIKKIINTNKIYYVRVAIILLMDYYLDEENLEDYFNLVSNVSLNEYYIEMAKAWYFATSFAKNFDKTFDFLKQNKSKFSKGELNKIISKCRDSFRIYGENKKLIKETLVYDKL